MSNTNYVFVIDTNKKPLQPCKPTVARRLLNSGKAAVWRRFPFTLILKKAVEIIVAKTTLTLKIDPGSKFTGMALLEGNKVIWMLEIQHRGSLISEKLSKRSCRRRARRTKNLRYRKPGLPNKKKPTGWLAPSVMHRVETTMTWVKRLIKFCPVESISMELVRFDTQLIQNPEISGTEYQQGELAGYELREYLLEKWHRKCAYCGKTDTPLEVEHIYPKSKGGSDRASNLTLACTKCNQAKGNQDVKDFLSGQPELLKRILTQAKAPLKDAAAVNSTRWKLFSTLKIMGLEVETASGGQTKFNRIKQELPKAHYIDAACVGIVDKLNFQTRQAILAICKGQGGRQKAAVNKYGYPIRYNPLKPIKGWNSGDLALNIETGQVGRVNPRSKSNSFNFTVPGQKAKSVNMSKLKVVHKKDGYTYTFCPQLSIKVEENAV